MELRTRPDDEELAAPDSNRVVVVSGRALHLNRV
jgi:hypothetical protein